MEQSFFALIWLLIGIGIGFYVNPPISSIPFNSLEEGQAYIKKQMRLHPFRQYYMSEASNKVFVWYKTLFQTYWAKN